MRTRKVNLFALLLAAAWMLGGSLAVPLAAADREIPAGTRFLVELRDKLEAKKVKRGRRFEAQTVEPIEAGDGSVIPADARLEGRVSYVKDNKMILSFERIESPWGRLPIVASVVSVVGEHDVKKQVDDEGEIKASGGRGKGTAIGAIIGGGLGAVIGEKTKGGKGAAVGAGAGGLTGGLIGAVSSGKNLVLEKGARLELELDRPLVIVTGG